MFAVPEAGRILTMLLLVAAAAIFFGRDECEKKSSTWIPAILAGSAIFLLVISFARIGDFFHGGTYDSMDAFFRLDYAMHWARSPFFAQTDHLWLTGNYALLGPFLWLLEDSFSAVMGFSLLSVAILLFGYCHLGLRLGLSPWGIAIGLCLMAFHPVLTPLYLTPMPDIAACGLVLVAVGCIIGAFQKGERGLGYLVAGQIAIAVLGTLRFEGWPLGGAGTLSVLVWWGINRKNLATPQTIASAVTAIIPFVFPALWMISSAVNLGSAVAFAQSGNPLLRHHTWGGMLSHQDGTPIAFGGRLKDGVYYVMLGVTLSFGLIPLALADSWLRGRRVAVAVTLAAACWAGILFTIGFYSGISANNPQRVMLPVAFLAALLAGDSLSLLFSGIQSRFAGRRLIASMVILVTVGIGVYAFSRAYRGLRKTFGMSMIGFMNQDAMLMGKRLRWEFEDSPRKFRYIDSDEPIRLWVTRDRGMGGEALMITILSGEPERFIVQGFADPSEIPIWDPEFGLVLVADGPTEDQMASVGFESVFTEGDYTLWVKPESRKPR